MERTPHPIIQKSEPENPTAITVATINKTITANTTLITILMKNKPNIQLIIDRERGDRKYHPSKTSSRS
jgi:hypothetical protein